MKKPKQRGWLTFPSVKEEGKTVRAPDFSDLVYIGERDRLAKMAKKFTDNQFKEFAEQGIVITPKESHDALWNNMFHKKMRELVIGAGLTTWG